MRNAERAFVYGGLVLAIGLGLGYRGLATTAGAASPVMAEPAAAKIATVDIIVVLEAMFAKPEFVAARQTEIESAKPLSDMIAGMEARLSKMDQNSPEFKAELPSYQAKVDELKKKEQLFNAFQGRQVTEAYKQASAAIKAVATAGGYNAVIMSRPIDAAFRAPNIDFTVQEVLQRPVIFTGEAQDITAAVMKELKIEAPKPATAVPAPVQPAAPNTPAPTPPAPGGASGGTPEKK